MIDLSQSDDFHDANLLSIDIDLPTSLLTCRVSAYLTREGLRERTPIVLRFRGVHSFSATADLEELQRHAAFGNIAHWSPRDGFNLISLAAGTITFDAARFEVVPELTDRT
jgi:hypothetical protein